MVPPIHRVDRLRAPRRHGVRARGAAIRARPPAVVTAMDRVRQPPTCSGWPVEGNSPRRDEVGVTPVRFGIVTPTLNAERFFERCLESIWAQQWDDVRIDHVVVDGESTD